MKSSENREVSLPHSMLTEWLEWERLPMDSRDDEGFWWQYDPRSDVERLLEQYQTLREAAQAVADARSYVSIDGRTVLADESLAERVDALRVVLNPAKKPYAPPVNPSNRLDRRGRIIE